MHAFAGARIAPHARRAPVDREAAEAADLDPVPAHQRVAHGVKNGLDGVFGVAVRELAEARGEFFDEIGAGHGSRKCHPGDTDHRPEQCLRRAWIASVRNDSPASYFSVLSSLARSRAPRLVVPAFSRADCWHRLAICALLVGHVLGLDGQLDVAGLAIDVHDHGRDFVAFLEHVAGIFHAVAGDFAGAQVADDVLAQVDLGALGRRRS